MHSHAYDRLLEEPAGFSPGIVVTPQQVASLHVNAWRDTAGTHFVPFGGLVLPFHEVILTKPEAVHEFVATHFTRKLRELTHEHPLYVRACAVTGRTALAQLCRKGLIVDLAVRRRVHDLVLNFPEALQFSTKQHILHKAWYFYTLLPSHRAILAKHFQVPSAPSLMPGFEPWPTR